MHKCDLLENDIEEKFVRSSGAGGHPPSPRLRSGRGGGLNIESLMINFGVTERKSHEIATSLRSSQ